MPTLSSCPGCGRPFGAALSSSGNQIRCPNCGRVSDLGPGEPVAVAQAGPVAGEPGAPAGEVIAQSWGSRLAEAWRGVLVGGALFLGAFPLLFWNEGRAVRTARSLEEGARAAVPVKADNVNPAAEGKLVHLSGQARTAETLTDPAFGVSVNAIRLRRVVEVYQWKEEKTTTKKKKAGGGEETQTTYNYKKVWSDQLHSSVGFHIQEGHQNPIRKPFDNQTWQAQTVTVGAFTLSPGLVKQIASEERLPAAAPAGGTRLPEKVRVQDGVFYAGADPNVPAVGDARVELKVVRPTTVSILARQAGNTLEPYPTQAGDEIELLEVGTHPPEQMFASAQGRNTALAWALRVAGFGMMAAGLFLVFRPLAVVADVIPFVGGLLGRGLWLFAGVTALVLSLLTVSVSWLLYRPGLGIPLVTAGLLGLALLFVGGRRRQVRAA